MLDLTGQRFGRLVVVECAGRYTKDPRIFAWKCLCDCGVAKEIAVSSLRRGLTRSCGCYRNELMGDRKRRHGETDTFLHKLWCSMKNRCHNSKDVKSFKNYGARGIEVCAAWRSSYETFRDWALANGYVHGLTIDRMNNYEGYSPDNCRFVTHKENSDNRRNSVLVEAYGEKKTAAQWEKDPRCQSSARLIRLRRWKGWSDWDSVAIPSSRRETYC